MGRRANLTPEKTWHEPSGQYRLRLLGKDHYLGADERAAEKKRMQILAEVTANAAADAPPLTPTKAGLSVSEAVLQYELRELREPGRYSLGQRQRIQIALDHLRARHGADPVSAFDQLALKNLRKQLLKLRAKQKRKGGEPPLLSRNYVNSLVGCIQTAWTWLVSEKLAPDGSNFALMSVRPLRRDQGGVERPRVRPVADAVVDKTLPKCNPVVRAMIEVLRWTSMRPGELCALTRGQLSLTPAEILYPPNHPSSTAARYEEIEGRRVLVWVYAPEKHKTRHKGKFRVVPIGPKAQTVLQRFLDRARERGSEARLFQPIDAVEMRREHLRALRKSKVQPSQQNRRKEHRARAPGDAYCVHSFRQAIRRACLRAEVPVWKPNQIRHLAATTSDALADRQTTQSLLGHGTPDMASTYAEETLKRGAAYVAANG